MLGTLYIIYICVIYIFIYLYHTHICKYVCVCVYMYMKEPQQGNATALIYREGRGARERGTPRLSAQRRAMVQPRCQRTAAASRSVPPPHGSPDLQAHRPSSWWESSFRFYPPGTPSSAPGSSERTGCGCWSAHPNTGTASPPSAARRADPPSSPGCTRRSWSWACGRGVAPSASALPGGQSAAVRKTRLLAFSSQDRLLPRRSPSVLWLLKAQCKL